MSDHGMNDFSESPNQGSFGVDSNGEVADVGNAALNVLDHQSLVSSPLKMATSAFKNRDELSSGVSMFRDDLRSIDWNGADGKVDAFKNKMGDANGKYDEFLHSTRKVVGIDPLKWLVGTLVDFLVQAFQPLEDVLGVVTGNEARMNVSSNMWQEVANAMPPIAEYMNSATTSELASWVGEDGETARTRIMEMGLLVDGLGYLAMGMQTILQMLAGVAAALRKFVQGLITDGVVWVIETIAPQLAASIATFGAAAPVCLAMTVAKIAGLVLDAIQMVNGAIQFFQNLNELFNLAQEVFAIFQPYLSRMIDIPAITSAP